MSQPTPTYPPPRYRVWPWLLIGALIGCAVLLLLWWFTAAVPRQVHYEITGVGRAANVSYANGDAVGQASNVALPWRLDVAEDQPWLVVQGAAGTNAIKCRILDDAGVVLAESPVFDYSCRIGLEHR